MAKHSKFHVQVVVYEHIFLQLEDDPNEPDDIDMCDVFDVANDLSTYEEARTLAERVAKTGKGMTASGM